MAIPHLVSRGGGAMPATNGAIADAVSATFAPLASAEAPSA